jgi:glycosyltransferase involved in cell wall biosynthesis
MKFSVLINNYNYARFLPETIASVAAQTLPAHEIIVVDDGSKDDSLAVLDSLRAAHPSLRVHAQANGGQLSAMRAAIRLATGDWCAFLDADDTWEPGHLAVAARAVADAPSASVYYSGHAETSGPPVYRSKWPAGPAGPFAALVSATGVRVGTITSTVSLRADLARQIADLPPELDADWRIRADDVLLYAAAFSGAVFVHEPAPTVRYRIHGGNAFAHGDNEARERAYVENKSRLFATCRARHGLDSSRHFELLQHEFCGLPAERRSHEVRRRYRRAIWRQSAPLPERLRALWRLFAG